MSIERAQVVIVSNFDGSNIEAETGSPPNKKPKLSTSVVANSATDDGDGTSLSGAQDRGTAKVHFEQQAHYFPGAAATDEILEYCTTHSYS